MCGHNDRKDRRPPFDHRLLAAHCWHCGLLRQGQKSSVILSIDSPAFHESFSFDDFAKVAQAGCQKVWPTKSPPTYIFACGSKKGTLKSQCGTMHITSAIRRCSAGMACEARANQRSFFLAQANARFTVQIGRRPHRLSRCNGSRVYVPAVSQSLC